MDWALIGKAVAMFAVTNVDDLVILAVFFGQAAGSGSAAVRVVVGQYLGFAAIVAVSVLGVLGTNLLPESAIPYLGLLPLGLGLHAAWSSWRQRDADDSEDDITTGRAGVWQMATVAFANGGDNIGVYVPVFAVTGAKGMTTCVVVFLIGVAVWCLASWILVRHRAVAAALTRWGHVVFPAVLIAIGLVILVEGGAFGL